MIVIKENLFRYILGISALFVAGVAAFFSIMGIGMLFSGAAVSAMVMATSLECGKIVATSYLYRYWSSTTSFLRVYLMMAVLLLVGITSLGVFGWLSSAYQSSSLQYEHSKKVTDSLIVQKKMTETEVATVRQRIDSLSSIRAEQEKRFGEVLNNPSISRNPTQLRQIQDQNTSMARQSDIEIGKEKDRYSELSKELFAYEKRILDSQTDSDQTKDIVTFKFVADAFGLDLNTTVKWFIIIIISVFDPLAVALILSYNVALSKETATPVIDVKKN